MLKPSYFILLFLLILASCKEAEVPTEPEPEEPKECVLDGTFTLINDSVSLSLQNSDSLLIEELSFFEKYCTFTYDSIGYRGSYGCVEPYIWVAVEGFDTLRLEQISSDEYSGEGIIQGKYLRKGSDQYKEALAALDPDANSKEKGNNDSKTVPNDEKKVERNDKVVKPGDKVVTPPTNTNTGLKTAKISFGDNLSGNTYRVRLDEPNTGGIKSATDAKIYLMLTVDALGSVMKAENIEAKTNTKDAQLIKDIIALAKKIKYNKESGAKLAKVPLTVTVNVD